MHYSSKALETQLERMRELESRLTFRLSVLSKLLDAQAQDLLDGSGINLTSYRILNIINTLGSTSVSDISRFCGIDRAQVSRSAIELQKQGLVSFEEDAGSKRKKLVAITEGGRDLLERLQPEFLKRNQTFETLLGPERKAALTEAISILTEHVAK